MKISDLRNLSGPKLKELLILTKKEFFKLKFNNKISLLKNKSQIKITRKIIAKILTILQEKNNK